MSKNKRYLWVTYNFENEERYYKARVQKDLFGNWSLLKSYGGKKNNLGQQRIKSCDSYEDAMKKLKQIMKVRKSHGYKIVGSKYKAKGASDIVRRH